MALQVEPFRGHCLEIPRTSLHFEHPVAMAAVEVVVVLLSGDFVPRGLTGQVDWNEPPVLLKTPQVSVYGCNPEPRHMVPCSFEQLPRAERVIRFLEDPADGASLTSLSLHLAPVRVRGNLFSTQV